MSERLDRAYFEWLVLVLGVSQPSNGGVRTLLDVLFRSRFEWFVEFDRNRAADGMSLRREYSFEHNDTVGVFGPDWFNVDCSMLEMLIALSRRMSIQTDISAPRCFWHMMRNIGLNQNSTEVEIVIASDKIVSRTYAPDGSDGGLFPLDDPDKDQRQVELLYQMYAYILENEF